MKELLFDFVSVTEKHFLSPLKIQNVITSFLYQLVTVSSAMFDCTMFDIPV